MSKDELMASPVGYADWLAELKQRIHAAQQRATLAVNRELVLLYWQIGQDILARQASQGWGSKVVDRLARDLCNAFPDMKGFSPRNLKYMRAFAEAWPDGEFVQVALAQLPWYHQLALLDKLQTAEERQWYAAQALENGWSRNVLVMQIESGLRQRTGAAICNFSQRLPRPQSDLARESLKDPYRLDFLGLGKEAQERAIEDALVKHVTQFLMELGAGFAFVGQQVHVEVGDKDFYIDLLFYHLKLRCYVVVELKAGEFQPEYAGKLNFYLSAVDSQFRHPSDNPSLGLLLCKNRDKVVAEYALRDMNKPIGVAEYQLVQALPKELQTDLPRIEDIESELRDADDAPGEAQA
ncbi:putative nuclease YhcG [Xanthomonas sacchari]|uniref:PDDEXK nuclease domain-containing protein n=1 Tax=Xanthomonas sacchari TaxID=56458 RepID=UPI00225E5E68|nr:PDDEXK nuclease domain-containing protein [Xanthomonas sacchari]MCW0459412.1 putative nuclease YhcG [Xanthomonas sacchari]